MPGRDQDCGVRGAFLRLCCAQNTDAAQLPCKGRRQKGDAMAETDGQAQTRRDKPWIFRTYAGHSTAREFEQALSPEPRQGPDRPFDRLRSADPDRLRQRPHPGARRGRQGRRCDLPYRRHAGAVRGDSARLDEHLDDHQRHRGVADWPFISRSRTSRARRAPACRAPPRTTSSKNIWREAPTSSRRTPR